MDPAVWRRDHPDRRLAGVATAVAHGLAVPVSLVRLSFIVLTFVHFVGAMAYAALWMVIPQHVGEASVLERTLDALRTLVQSLFGPPPRSGGPSAPHVVPGDPLA